METVRWKRLLIATDSAAKAACASTRRQPNTSHHRVAQAVEAVATEPWLMVPATDLSRAIALSRD
jgi:hypothetical protein